MAAHRALQAGAHRRARRTRTVLRPMRAVVAVVAALATVLVATGVAVAYFSGAGSAMGTATTGTLAAPTAVTGSHVDGTGTVAVSWTASAGTPTPTGYYVVRVSSSGPAQPACGTSPSSTTSSTSCTDSGVPLGSYSYRVTAIYRTWTAASSPSAVVTVGQVAQSITFTSAPTSPTYGGSYHVTATGGASGNPVVFSSGTPAVCTVSGSTVSFVHAGTCTVDADQAGSTYYAAAPQAQQTFTVARATQTVAFTSTAPTAAVVGGSGYTPTATGGASGNPVTLSVDATTSGICSLAAGVVTYQHVGTCTVDANQAGTADYLPANQVQQSWTVGPGSQAITFTSVAPANAKVGDTYTVSATGGASGNAVTFSIDATSAGICAIAGTTVTFTGAGTCRVDANQAGNADYLAAAQVQQQVTVTRTDQTITFTSTPTGPAYGGSYTVSATGGGSGNPVTFTGTAGVCTTSGTNGSSVSFVGAGTCTITANQAGNTAYNAAAPATQTFTVAKADQAITFPQPTSPAAAGTTATLNATASSGLTVAFSTSSASSVCTVSGTTVTYVGAGTCTITAAQAGNANWNAASVTRTVTVTAPTFTITGRSTGTPQNTTVVSGTGNPGSSVSVYLCGGSQASCGASGPSLVSTPNFANPQTTTVAANGSWSVTFSKLGNGAATYTAQAVQSAPTATSNTLVFSVS